MNTFTLPDLGEGLQDAELVAWHVAAGDHVVADQPLASVETEKAVVEIPSPRSGHIARLCAKPGDRVKVGAPLVEFEEAAHADEGAVVGQLPEPPRPKAPARPPSTAKASPAVRSLAARLGVDLASVPATGPEGTITAAAVEAAAAQGGKGAAAAPAVAGERLSALRRAMAVNMARAHAQVVPATVCDDADLGLWAADENVMPRLVRAIVAGTAAEPAVNAWFDGTAQTLQRRPTVDIGVAVDTDAGLIVPVLRDAGGLAPAQMGAELLRLKNGALARSLAPAELRGASFTLSNFGAIAGRYAQLVVVPPQVAILGAGHVALRAVAGQRGPENRRVLPLSLTFDHRALTGGEAARFLAAAIADLQRAI